MMGGELRPSRPGSPRRISGVLRLTTPLSPNVPPGSPVFASSEYNLPSFDPKPICGLVCASPGQYSTPRVDGLPDGSLNDQISAPVLESSATTREYGVVMNIVPSTTRGVTSLEARRVSAAGFMW